MVHVALAWHVLEVAPTGKKPWSQLKVSTTPSAASIVQPLMDPFRGIAGHGHTP